MNRGIQVLLVAIVLVAAIAGVLLFVVMQESGAPLGPTPELELETGTTPAEIDASAPQLEEGARIAAPVEVVEEEVPEPLAVKDERPETGYLTGRILSGNQRPIAGAEVEVSFLPTRDFSLLDLELKHTERKVAEGRTDSDGRFRISVPAARPLHLTIACPGFGRAKRQPVYAGEDHTIVMDVGASVEGRVTLRRTGEPLAGIKLHAFRRGTRGDVFAGESGPDGRFRFDNIRPGVITIDCEPEEHASPEWEPVELIAGEVYVHEIALEDGVVVYGRVTDAASGAPIADAEIWEGWFGRKRIKTDVNGDYRVHGFGGPGVFDLHVHAKGYGTTQHEFAYTDMPKEDLELNFKLLPAHRARGRVVDSRGKPVADAYVAAVDSVHQNGQQETDWTATRTNADGSYELDTLHPGHKHALFVQKTGYGTVIYNFPPSEAENTEIVLEDIVMPASARIEGVIVDTSGKPIPDMTVMLEGWNDDYARFSPGASWGMDQGITKSYIGRRSAHSDVNGRFYFSDLAAGTYELVCRKGRSATRDERTLVIEAGQWMNDLRIEYSLGLSLSGHVVTVDGYGLSSIQVRAMFEEHSSKASATSAEGGSFKLEGLEPGTYTLVADPIFFKYGEGEPHFGWTSIQIELPADDVRIVMREAVLLEGIVLDANSKPWPKAFVFFKNAAGWQVAWDVCDDEGKFSAYVLPDAPVEIRGSPTEKSSTSSFGVSMTGNSNDSVTEHGVTGPRSGITIQLPVIYEP